MHFGVGAIAQTNCQENTIHLTRELEALRAEQQNSEGLVPQIAALEKSLAEVQSENAALKDDLKEKVPHTRKPGHVASLLHQSARLGAFADDLNKARQAASAVPATHVAELERSNRSMLNELKLASEKLKELDALHDERADLKVVRHLTSCWLTCRRSN